MLYLSKVMRDARKLIIHNIIYSVKLCHNFIILNYALVFGIRIYAWREHERIYRSLPKEPKRY